MELIARSLGPLRMAPLPTFSPHKKLGHAVLSANSEI